MPERIIFHCDCNSFFASVELLSYPHLAEVPVAVAGNAENRHGIILAKNEAAKKFGVKTAETVWQAKKKCPNITLLPPHHRQYSKYSKIINTIYGDFTDRVEPFGIDESWLDMTGSWQLFGKSPVNVANILRAKVKEKTGITISVGVSFNKIFAKLGSDYKKPDATTEITKDNYKQILWPLPAADMLYVGKKAAETLANLGISTIGQLAAADETLLKQLLGKQGTMLTAYANGQDDTPVAYTGVSEPVKSVGNGLTFKRNLLGKRDVFTAVNALCDEVAARLRAKKLYAASLQVLIKNTELKSITRQMPMPFASNLAKDITKTAMLLIENNWDYAKPIRMLTITAQNLTNMPFASQTSLFESEPTGINPRREKLEGSIDGIRQRFGKAAIQSGAILHNDLGISPGDEDE